MKSNTKKRLIAFMLCMVLVLSSATSAFADDNVDGFNDKTGCQAMTLTQEMKNADDQTIGTVYADIPENAFYLDDPSDKITMDLAKVENEESILDAIQSNLKEHEALTDAVMCKVDFKVNGVSAAPNTAIALRFENLNMNSENATAFSHDTSLKIIDKTVVSAGEEQALQISADKNQIYGFYTVETVVEEKNVTKSETVTFNNDDIATVATGDSTYTIRATKPLQVHVTYRVNGTDTKLFAGKTYTLNNGGTLNLAAQKSDNYTVASVYKADENGNKTGNALILRHDGNIAESLSENTNYCVFYQATTDNNFSGNVTFYDYQINPPEGKKSINDPSYYGEAESNRRFAMGNSGYRKPGEDYSVYKNYNDTGNVDINEWNEKRSFYIYKDIITGVDVSTGALVMGTNNKGEQIVEPGLFTATNAGDGLGKQIYTDFNLKFNRTGNEYKLSAVERDGQTVVSDMGSFFPLDANAYKGKEKDGGEAYGDRNHNYYFGMRYDIQFELKDYIGALTYSFTGDDDLWVVMDGNQVVVDVGGIHDQMKGDVDLWTVLLGKKSYTDEEKEAYVAKYGFKQHQLTVLYLERGACKSNCNMTYVLPNSSIVNPGEIQNNWEQSKTAQLVDWNARTYDITLSASSLVKTAEDTLPISGAVVRDYIDPRFELVTSTENIAAMGGEIKTDETTGQTYIEWNNAVIGKKGTDGTPGWSKTIRVKAKDAYIGGNDVVTNGPESGITVGTDDRKFNQPTVNVKVDFNVNNDEKTIFKGDKPGDYIDEAKLNEVTKLKSTTGTEYTMLDDVNVTTQWYKDEKCTQEISNNGILNTPLTEKTVYYAKVTVTPKSDGTASAANSIGNQNGNCTQDGKKYYAVASDGVTQKGTYTIKLVSGEINITKKLESATDTDKDFNFTITRTDVTPNQEIATVKVTVAVGQTTGTLAGDELNKVSNLARGTYVVTENETTGYDVKAVKGILEGLSTNCQIAGTTDDSITFVMGRDNDGNDVIGMDKVGNITTSTYNNPAGILGVVEYTNEEVTNGWGIKKVSASSDNPYIYLEGAKFKLTSTANSSVAYYGKSNENGLLIWYKTEACADSDQIATLPKGTYTMEEKIAPAGYKCSTEKWQIQITKNGALNSITSSVNGTLIKTVTEEVNDKNVIYYLYQNEALYALPSAGGTGIYLYMIGGMLLMFAAVWILYKNKCKEVLGK